MKGKLPERGGFPPLRPAPEDPQALRAVEGAGLGIAVIGGEGASAETLRAADAIVRSIGEALDLVASPERLVATLRG